MALFSNPKRRMERYVAQNPTIKVIVVCGSYGRKSAIRALAIILGQTMKVTMGINKNVLEDVRSCAEMVAERSRAELVTVIGRKFIMYKPFKDKPVIKLPRQKKAADE